MYSDLVSVIIPVYNVEKYLERCLNSVINQTYQNLEIIIINDGSTDSSQEIIDRFVKMDSRIKVYKQINKGLSEARNLGIFESRGEYIFFTDSDDWLEIDAIDYLIKKLKKYNADIAVGGINRTNSKKEKKYNVVISENLLSQKEYAKKYFKIGTQRIEYYVWNKLYKRSVIEGIKFPSGFYAEDVPTTFQYILKSQRIFLSNKIVYNYYINNNGLTSTFSKKHFDVLKCWDLVINESINYGDSDYIMWSKFNRKRADFAILMEIALSKNYKKIKRKYKNRIKSIEFNLQKNKNELLKSSIPLNRKLLIKLFTLNYSLFSKVINLLRKVSKVL